MKLTAGLVHRLRLLFLSLCWYHRTNTAAALTHKIFIHDTCFIIRIDPLPASSPFTLLY